MDQKNPYSSPVNLPPHPNTGGVTSSLLGQLKALCIIMIVVGVLEILMGLFYAVMAFVMPTILANAGGPGGNGMQAQQQQTMQTMFGLIYGLGGGLAMLAGTLRIVAGIQGLRLKGWKLGIASHLTGLLSSLTCYCVPTALALAIWGMILYLMPEVKYAFQNSEAGGVQGQASGRYSK